MCHRLIWPRTEGSGKLRSNEADVIKPNLVAWPEAVFYDVNDLNILQGQTIKTSGKMRNLGIEGKSLHIFPSLMFLCSDYDTCHLFNKCQAHTG